MKIKNIEAREILDSRGFPTLECKLILENDFFVVSSVPSGASVGMFEAVELRDGDPKRYMGKGVLKAKANIEEKIKPLCVGEVVNLKELDNKLLLLDGTKNKSNLGANAILAVSMAVARAQAYMEKKELFQFIADFSGNKKIVLPKCMFNILNGGVHAENGIPFQEFMIMPLREECFAKDLQDSVIVYNNLKKILKKEGYALGVGDEGGFAPRIYSSSGSEIKKVLGFLKKAVEVSGLIPGKDIVFCLDIAASQFYDEDKKSYLFLNKNFAYEDMIEFYSSLISEYPIFSMEDGLSEEDWQGWKVLTEIIGNEVQLVGDDIFVTNTDLIKRGIKEKVANAVLIKPNQIGTVTETLEAIQVAKDAGYKCVISHRSGETNDSFISDLAVGTGVGQLKAGAPCRGERVAKYNRLLEIEDNFKIKF